jgi:enediyne biosynthesis protein E4
MADAESRRWRPGHALQVALVAAALAGSNPARACPGDCNGDGAVAVAELVRAVGIALGSGAVATCAAADANADGRVTIAELIGAVGHALSGCPPPPTATETSTSTRAATGTAAATPSATATATPTATAATPAATATWGFVDVTEEAGLAYEHVYRRDPETPFNEPRWTAGGVAAGDYDGDGCVDLYVVRGDEPNLLLRNDCDGHFADVTAAAGVAREGLYASGPIFADYDGDGDLDLLVLGVDPALGPRPTLFRQNPDHTFDDVTELAGLSLLRDSYSAAFADYDRDGDLDLFVAHWGIPLLPDQSTRSLWRNGGDGTFTDVSVAAGIRGFEYLMSLFALAFTPNFADVDSDGWPDLLVASDFGSSKVYLNRRDGTFADATTAAISDENGMGGAVGDYDNDGDLDWFVSSIHDPDGVTSQSWGITGNRLYRNRGDGSFDDVTDEAGVREGFWGWGATFADLDNDGHLDLYHVNGWGELDDVHSRNFHFDPARLYVARGDGTFAERAAELGVADTGQGRGVVAFDYDRDGDLDLLVANNQGPLRLFRNQGGNRKPALSVSLRGPAANSEAIGARVEIRAAGRTQMRELRAGSNFVSQDPAVAHFGLGDAAAVERLVVRWPDGAETVMEPGPAPGSLVISHPAAAGSPLPAGRSR